MTNSRYFALIISVTLLLMSQPGIAQEKKVSPPRWSYSGATGPAKWGSLSPDYALCGTGKSQSPVNIVGAVQGGTGSLEFDYRDSPLKVLNTGRTAKIPYEAKSHIRAGGDVYKLKQFHFHSPSENTLNDKRFAMEMHLVHRNTKGELTVVGVFFKKGATNLNIRKLWGVIPEKAKNEGSLPGSFINAAAFLPTNGSYFHFKGSLTTPPCSENVNWYILKTPLEISEEQIKTFVNLMQKNARPVQAMNERKVQEVSAQTLARFTHIPTGDTGEPTKESIGQKRKYSNSIWILLGLVVLIGLGALGFFLQSRK